MMALDLSKVTTNKWTREEAIDLCRLIENIAPRFGCHVALTGGTLYKDGPRKDLDILFYRIRQVPEIDVPALMGALAEIGIKQTGGFGWCFKGLYHNKKIDMFFPEDPTGGEYNGGGEDL